MASIFDILSKDTAIQKGPVSMDQTEKAQKIVRTGITGKAIEGPKRQQLTDQINASQLQSQLSQLGQQKRSAIQETEQAAQFAREQAQLQQRGLTQQFAQQKEQLQQATDQTLRQFEQGQEVLDYQKNGAQLEQLGHNMRLADDRYVFDLQMSGARARLDNQLAFKEQLAQDVFVKERQLLESDLAFKEAMLGDDLAFNRMINNLNMDAVARWQRENERYAARAAPFTILAAAPGAVSQYYAAKNMIDDSDTKMEQGEFTSGNVDYTQVTTGNIS